MPEQIALSELVLSVTYKRCQRALAQWLEHRSGTPLTVTGMHRTLQGLSGSERTRLLRWLDWQLYAARHNGNLAGTARIERLAAWLGRSLPHEHETAQAPAVIAVTGRARLRSA